MNLAVHGLEGAIKQGSAYYEDFHHAVGPNLFYTVTLPCILWFLDRGKKGTPRADTVLFLDARHIYRQIDRAHRDWTPAQIGFLANVVRLYRGEAPGFTLGGGEARAKLEEVFAVRDVSGVSGRVGVPPAVSRVSRETSDVADAPSAKNAAQRRGVSGGTPTLPLRYRDVSGLCKAATLAEIEAQGWSLNPGHYVGVAPGEEVSGEDFKAQLESASTSRAADDTANLAFIGGKTNRSISDKPPAEYFPALLEKAGQAAFDSQCIPTHPDLLRVEGCKDFLAERRKEISRRLNEFLGTGTDPSAPSSAPAPKSATK